MGSTSQSKVALANARDLFGSWERISKSTVSFPECFCLSMMVSGSSSHLLHIGTTPFRQTCWHSEPKACNALIVIGRVSEHPFCHTLSCPSLLALLCRSLLLLDVLVLDLQTCACIGT